VATVLDEIMAEAAGRALSRHVLTISLRVRYIEPMRTNELYRLQARVTSLAEGQVSVQGEVIGRDLVAAATANFRAFQPSPS
jgi:acyl-coenzyme A thioesterase PaaI-like protein